MDSKSDYAPYGPSPRNSLAPRQEQQQPYWDRSPHYRDQNPYHQDQNGFYRDRSPHPDRSSQYQDRSPRYQNQPPSYLDAVDEPVRLPQRGLSDAKPRPASNRGSQSSSPVDGAPSPSKFSPNTRLEKPVAIPATLSAQGSPFLRAYPPCLQAYGISPSLFLNFLDKLNRVAVKSPPLQVLAGVGGLVGFVPLATAQIVSQSISTAANLSTMAINYGRTEMELSKANADIFGPRGLKVEIAKIDAVAKLTGMPILDAGGKIDKKATLLKPIEAGDVGISGQQRRLETMEPWIAPLELAVLPEVEVPDNALSKLNIKVYERDRTKGEEKLVKKRDKVLAEYQGEAQKIQDSFDKKVDKLDRDLDKEMARADRRHGSRGDREKDKVMHKYERERAKEQKDYDKEMGKIEKDRRKDDLEEKSMRKILWLLVREKDAPSGTGPNPDLRRA